jgi:hypothetical protein
MSTTSRAHVLESFNAWLSGSGEQQVPSEAQLARVIPLYNTGEPKELPNYRPISLLKIYVRILKTSWSTEWTRNAHNTDSLQDAAHRTQSTSSAEPWNEQNAQEPQFMAQHWSGRSASTDYTTTRSLNPWTNITYHRKCRKRWPGSTTAPHDGQK